MDLRVWLVALTMLGFPLAVFLGAGYTVQELSGRIPKHGERGLGMRFGYDAATIERVWTPDDPAKRKRAIDGERLFLKLDLLFPIFYGFALATGILIGLAAAGFPSGSSLALVPVAVSVVADWTENAAQLRLLAEFEARRQLSASLVQIASAATVTKLLALIVSMATVVGLAVNLVVLAMHRP